MRIFGKKSRMGDSGGGRAGLGKNMILCFFCFLYVEPEVSVIHPYELFNLELSEVETHEN